MINFFSITTINFFFENRDQLFFRFFTTPQKTRKNPIFTPKPEKTRFLPPKPEKTRFLTQKPEKTRFLTQKPEKNPIFDPPDPKNPIFYRARLGPRGGYVNGSHLEKNPGRFWGFFDFWPPGPENSRFLTQNPEKNRFLPPPDPKNPQKPQKMSKNVKKWHFFGKNRVFFNIFKNPQ